MFNPLLAVEKFLDHNIETGNIWYYIIGAVALVLYFIIFQKKEKKKKLFFDEPNNSLNFLGIKSIIFDHLHNCTPYFLIELFVLGFPL